MTSHTIKSYPMAILALLTWGLATGFVVEAMLVGGVKSWTLFAASPILTAAVGILLHMGITDISWSPRIFRAPFAIALGVLGLSVTLPSSIGTVSAAKEQTIAAAEATNQSADDVRKEVKESLERMRKKLKWAENDQAQICKRFGPKSDECAGAKDTVKSFSDREEKLMTHTAPIKAPVMAGEERIVWAFGLANLAVKDVDVKNATTLLPPLVVELMFGFFYAAMWGKKKVPVVVETAETEQETDWNDDEAPEFPPQPRTRKKKDATQNAIDFTAAHIRRHGHPPSWTAVRSYEPKLSKASASRARKEGIRVAVA